MRNSLSYVARIAGGVLAACALYIAATSPSIGGQATTATIYHAWTTAGTLTNVRVMKTLSGTCWTQSLVTSRGDAFRCIIGNDIFDPCFTPRTSHPPSLACPESPFLNRVVLLRLKKPLPSPNSTTQWLQPHNQPWGLRLMNGDRCVFETGATDVIKGERMNYSCAGKDAWLIGLPDQRKPVWTIQSSDYPSKGVKLVSIAEAVF
jgi:hypothetical protein